MFRTLAAITALAVLVLAGCATPANNVRSDAKARNCFSASSVRSFSAVNDTTIRLDVGMREQYELTLLGYCPEVDWTHSLGLRTMSGSSWICANDAMNVEVIVLDRATPIGPDRCRVRSIRQLDAEELAAEKASREEARAERKARQ